MGDDTTARPDGGTQESVGTVLLAGAMNLSIAVAKAVAGVFSGSAAMLSESAHSVADTATEVFLFVALRRGARRPDSRHPLGYGREAYFWAFLAATFTFVIGGGFSITHGVGEILGAEAPGDYLVSYLVLGVSFVLEAISLIRAVRQSRRSARRWRTDMVTYLRHTPDTTVKAVVLEDTAALIGLVLAAAGLALTEITGDARYDGVASVLIGLLLIAVAIVLAAANTSLLIGQAVPPRLQSMVRDELLATDTVRAVDELYILHLGPDSIFVAAKVDFTDTATGAAIEAASDAAENRLRERIPSIDYVFLDPSPGPNRPR
ncbi:cation diffusion facilitator family transporter [Stackebrandtia albiflava]|uniref:Cation diffusion facilitator family transporter n=1 Tax=Stackebrandtia albiflava TaxID=406432 RepID=A0A562VB49_9ACTN|nr:cation diffusion facilitator family transporter [Stackebrandtia albiflava]TWJ15119.1 cation diffusion facilitator family transporter [Stackebrandtia albiflava]